jgi:hypothetical protein
VAISCDLLLVSRGGIQGTYLFRNQTSLSALPFPDNGKAIAIAAPRNDSLLRCWFAAGFILPFIGIAIGRYGFIHRV